MRRNFALGLFSILLGTLFVFSSCQQEKNYINALPADAAIVLSFNADNLAKKADLATLVTPEMTGKLITSLQNGQNSETSALIEKIVKNPSESGIDFSKDFFLFFSMQKTNGGILAAVKDAGKLGILIESMAKEGACTVEKSGGQTIAVFGNQAVCVFSDAVFMVQSKPKNGAIEALSTDVKGLLNQPEGESLFANETFRASLAEQKDFNIWGSLAGYPDQMKNMYKTMFPDLDMSSVVFDASVQFDNGNINMTSKSTSTDPETSKVLEQYNEKIMGKMTGKFLKYVPENSWMCMGANIKDGKAFVDILSRSPEVRQQFDVLVQQANLDFGKLLSSLNGEILIGVGQPIGPTLPVPQFTLLMETSDNSFVTLVNTLLAAKKIPSQEVTPDNYKFSFPLFNLNIYWGYRDGYFYATDDNNVYAALTGGADMKTSFADAPQTKIFKDGYSAFLFDMPLFLQGYQASFPPQFHAVVPVLKQIQSFDAEQSGDMTSEGNIRLTNTSENSLKVLISEIIKQVK